MKILLAIAHFYRAEENSIYTSTSGAGREARAAGIRNVIESWRGHLDPPCVLNINGQRYDQLDAAEDLLDIAVLIRGADHLLDREYCRRMRVRPIQVATDNPRLIPFAAHRLFADSRQSYDMFVYSEDDLRLVDAYLPMKIASFVEAFGRGRVLMPNRYEWNLTGPACKTYVDGDLAPTFTDKFFEALPDEPILRHKALGREISYRRARNPHAGCFAIMAEQLEHWVKQPHFLDHDCSFFGPLESAATLALMKTFSLYKTEGRDMGWLEIEHLDNRYSSLNWQRPA